MDYVHAGSHIITDEHSNTPLIAKENDFLHEVIDHANEYVRGHVHTNGIENFWALLKRGLGGTYVSVDLFRFSFRLEREGTMAGQQTAEVGRLAAQKEIHRWIRESAAMVCSAALSEATLDAIDEEEFRSRIPSDFQDTFIKSLLDAKLCICGRSLEKGGEAWAAVEALLTQGGRKDVVDIALRVKSTADRFSRSIAKARSDVGFYEDRVRSFERDLNAANRDFEELSVDIDAEDLQNIDLVTRMVSEKGFRVSRFTSREGSEDRREILSMFRTGNIEVLTAIRCLDEGVNIPACETAFILASSANPHR